MDNAPADHIRTARGGGISTFMGLPHSRDLAGVDVAIFGIPFDSGGTPGSRWAPRLIRDLSALLRASHAWHGLEIFRHIRAVDYGDVPVQPPLVDRSLGLIQATAAEIAAAGAIPIGIGGDHGVTLGELRAAAAAGPVSLVQFDAHTDTYDVYYDDVRYTSGTPFRRAAEEGVVDAGSSIMVGLRGSVYTARDYDDARDLGYEIITAEEVAEIGPAAVAERIKARVRGNRTFLTFDIDALDPAHAPATGTLETGGLTTREAQAILRRLRGIDFVGFDQVEVNPAFDGARITAAAGATIIFEFLALVAMMKGAS
jgi:agmatinase